MPGNNEFQESSSLGWDNTEFFLHCLPGLPSRMEPSWSQCTVLYQECSSLITLSLLTHLCLTFNSPPNVSWGHLHLHSNSCLRSASEVPKSCWGQFRHHLEPAAREAHPRPCPWVLSFTEVGPAGICMASGSPASCLH